MRPELLDILSRKQVGIDNDTLEKYLSGQLSDEARHQVEKVLQEGDELEEEAWDGWQNAADKKELVKHAHEINLRLNQQLGATTKRKRRRPIKDLPVTWLVFGLLLVVIFIAWAIIKLMAE